VCARHLIEVAVAIAVNFHSLGDPNAVNSAKLIDPLAVD